MEPIFSLFNPNNRMKTLYFVLLSIATFGIYPIIYMWRISPLLENHLKKKMPDTGLLYAATVSYGLMILITILAFASLLSMIGEISFYDLEFFMTLNNLTDFLWLISIIIFITWSIKVQNLIREYVVEQKLNININQIYTIIFTTFYINYLVNQMIEEQSNKGETIK